MADVTAHRGTRCSAHRCCARPSCSACLSLNRCGPTSRLLLRAPHAAEVGTRAPSRDTSRGCVHGSDTGAATEGVLPPCRRGRFERARQLGIPIDALLPRMGLTNDRFEAFLRKQAKLQCDDGAVRLSDSIRTATSRRPPELEASIFDVHFAADRVCGSRLPSAVSRWQRFADW
eukprot:2442054-Prymnesium_polylepis.1